MESSELRYRSERHRRGTAPLQSGRFRQSVLSQLSSLQASREHGFSGTGGWIRWPYLSEALRRLEDTHRSAARASLLQSSAAAGDAGTVLSVAALRVARRIR